VRGFLTFLARFILRHGAAATAASIDGVQGGLFSSGVLAQARRGHRTPGSSRVDRCKRACSSSVSPLAPHAGAMCRVPQPSVPRILFSHVKKGRVLSERAHPLLTPLFELATGLGARLDIVLQRCRAAPHGRRDHKGAAPCPAPAALTGCVAVCAARSSATHRAPPHAGLQTNASWLELCGG